MKKHVEKEAIRYTCASLQVTEDGFISDLRDTIKDFAIENAIKNNKYFIEEKDMKLAIKLAIDKVSKAMPVDPEPESEIVQGCGRYPNRCHNSDLEVTR